MESLSKADPNGTSPLLNQTAFQKLIRYKYMLPMSIIESQEWFDEIVSPLNITINEIRKDLSKFANGFPMDRIPHIPYDYKKKATELEGTIRDPENPDDPPNSSPGPIK